MLVSTKGRYALRVMVDLAEHQAAGRIPLKEIAARQGISEKYLENILATLVRANMLSGMRGKGGGYVLTRPPELLEQERGDGRIPGLKKGFPGEGGNMDFDALLDRVEAGIAERLHELEAGDVAAVDPTSSASCLSAACSAPSPASRR